MTADAALAERFSECPAARHARSRDLMTFVDDRPGHDRRYAINCARIETEMGVLPRTALSEGLARTIEWYLASESWWRRLLDGEWRGWMQRHYGTAV